MSVTDATEPIRWLAPLAIVNPMHEFNRSVAVTIGIDEYSRGIPRLRTAVNDARLLATTLREEHGYHVACLSEEVTLARLDELFCTVLPARLSSDARLFIHFAGHGVALDGDDGPQGYLLPQDADPDAPESFLSMQTFRQWIDDLPCRHLLLVLDCCFAGAFRWSGTRDTRRVADELAAERYNHYLTNRAWQVITSSAYNQRAYDQIVFHNILGQRGETIFDTKPHSPFALALFEGLAGRADLWPRQGGDGVITAGELQVYLSHQVADVTRNAQTPQLWPLPQHDCGEYIFLIPGCEPALPFAEPLDAKNSPWRGLQPYGAEHADIFCGRDALTDQLTRRVVVDALPLIVVVGGSGTGKSSLVQAGLIPRLQQMMTLDGQPTWRVLATIRPGSQPVRTMVKTVHAALGEADPAPDLGEEDCRWCADRIREWLDGHPERRMLLVLDQFEEIVTFCKDKAERRRFLMLLGWLMDQHFARLQVIITLRADFEPHFRDIPFAGAWRRGRFVVRPLSLEELREIVEGPAGAREIYFESAKLVHDIIDEVAQTPGALPLLSFTLHELYLRYLQRQEEAQHRDQIIERCLTVQDYLNLGGVVGALGRRANDLFGRLTQNEQATMQRVMLRMVATEGGELARRRVPLWELKFDPPAEAIRVHTVVNGMVESRLVVEDRDPVAAEDYVEPAHDALIRAWDRILQWRDEAGEILPLQRRLSRAAHDWMKADAAHKQRLLWTNNSRLPQVHQILAPQDYAPAQDEAGAGVRSDNWSLLIRRLFFPTIDAPAGPTPLNHIETAFVQQSVHKRAESLRRLALTVAITLIALVTLTGVANWQRQRAVASRLETMVETALRQAEASLAALSVAPRDSLKIALEVLPQDDSDDQPYVPQAELALSQALRAHQELAHVTTGATTAAQVGLTAERIAVGDDSLRLYDHNLVHQATFETGAIREVIAAPDGRLIAYGDHAIFIVRDDSLVHSRHFDEPNVIACASWQPEADGVVLCLGEPGDMTLWLWSPDQDPGRDLRRLSAGLDPYGSVARHGAVWSPDGTRLAIRGGSVIVWEPGANRAFALPVTLSDSGRHHIQFAAWSADGATLLTAWNNQSTVYLWSMAEPQHATSVEIGSVVLGGRSLSPFVVDELDMAIWTQDGRAVVLNIDPAGHEEPRNLILPGAIGAIKEMVPSVTGASMLSILDSGQVYLWTAEKGVRACGGQHESAVFAAAWQGNHVVTAGGDGVVRIWRVTGDGGTPCTIEAKLPKQARAVTSLTWLDEQRLLTFSEADPGETIEGALRIWAVFDDAQRLVCRQAQSGNYPECLTYSIPIPVSHPDVMIVSARWLDDATVITEEITDTDLVRRAWEIADADIGRRAWIQIADGSKPPVISDRHSWTVQTPATAQVAWNPGATTVLIYGMEEGGTVQRWEDGAWRRNRLFTEPVDRAHWLETGSFWQLARGDGYYVTPAGAIYAIPDLPVHVAELGGGRLAVADGEDAIRVWTLSDAEPALTFSVTEAALLSELQSTASPELARVKSIKASADGRYLAAVLDSGHVAIWDLEDDGALQAWDYPNDEYANLPFAWHPTRPVLVTAQSGQLFVLSIIDGRIQVHQTEAIAGDIRHVSWQGRPDHILVQDSRYARLWRWNADDGELHEIMRAPHTEAYTPPALSANGARLIAYDEEWGWRIWETWPTCQDLVAEARNLVKSDQAGN